MTTINHAEREHSIWSPSAYGRWSRCPASALRCKDVERTSSPAADRGTWMHEQTEAILRTGEPTADAHGSEWDTEANWKDIHTVVDEMRDLIDSCSVVDEAVVAFEERVDLDCFGYDDVFGTCDLSILDSMMNELYIIDYKFGSDPVPAKDNGQLLIYALGKCMMLENMPEHVTLMIRQPGLPQGGSVHRMKFGNLMNWWNAEGEEAILAARKKDAPAIPGPQCKWCPVSGDCPEQRQDMLSLVDDHPLTTDDGLGHLLERLPELEAFIKGVRNIALDRLKKGLPVPGYKLVQGQTKRKWIDEDKVDRWLASRKIPVADRRVTKVIGIPAVEELLAEELKTNKRLRSSLDKLIYKPEGKPTLARDTDKRDAISVTNPVLEDIDI